MLLSKNVFVKDISALNLLGSLFNLPVFESFENDIRTNPTFQSLMNLQLPHSMSKEFSLLRFIIKDKRMTVSDKLHYLHLNLSTNTLTIINIHELIINNPVLSRWWNTSVETLSNNTWLPGNIATGSSTSCLKECLPNMGSNTWFSVTSTQSVNIPNRILKRPYTDTLHSDANSPNGVMKIRLYPNQHQKNILQQMFDANRYSYNKVIEVIGDKMFDFSPGVFDTVYKDARRYITKKHMKHLDIPERVFNTNNVVLNSAYRDVLKAQKSMIAASIARKEKTGKGFKLDKLKYRSKKRMSSESIEIQQRGIKTINNKFVTFFPLLFKKGISAKKAKDVAAQIRIKIPLPKLEFSVRLQRIKPNIYYLCIPIIKTVKPITTNKICSVDPGVRTMLTIFDPDDKQVYMIGNNVDELVKRSKIIDKMKSKLRKFKGKRNARYRLKRDMQFMQRKIKNMTNDMHQKTSKFLSENYKTIIYPKFNIKGMCNRKHRNIGKETARRMYLWGHYKFRELLKYKTALKGGRVVDCTEEYTSKTCTCCGRLNHTLGASKIFKCPYCEYKVDRDVGAARNIYLKNNHLLV